MKNYILFFLLIIFPLNIFAGIIVLKTGDNIEEISNISIQDQLVLYQQNGKKMSLSIEDVSAIVYDDGNYEEIRHKSSNYQEYSPQETYSNADNETHIEYSANPVSNNNLITKEEIQQRRTQRKAESKETMKAWGNWMKSAFKGDKDGWNPAKNPLWNKESRAKYSGGSAPETQSPTPSSSNDPAQSNDNNW